MASGSSLSIGVDIERDRERERVGADWRERIRKERNGCSVSGLSLTHWKMERGMIGNGCLKIFEPTF